jgi:hypothetical protein
MRRGIPKGGCPLEKSGEREACALRHKRQTLAIDRSIKQKDIEVDYDDEYIETMGELYDEETGLPLAESVDTATQRIGAHCGECGHECRVYANYERALALGVVERHAEEDEEEFGRADSPADYLASNAVNLDETDFSVDDTPEEDFSSVFDEFDEDANPLEGIEDWDVKDEDDMDWGDDDDDDDYNFF